MTLGYIAVVLATTWLAVTLLFQFRPFSLRYQTLDRLGILPRWLFFTQGVGSYSLAVELRFRDVDGSIGAWQPAPLWTPHRWWHAIFYADGAVTGALWLAVDRVARRAERGDDAATLAGTQAVATLRNHLLRALPGRDLQFVVLRSTGVADDPRPIFLSEFCGR